MKSSPEAVQKLEKMMRAAIEDNHLDQQKATDAFCAAVADTEDFGVAWALCLYGQQTEIWRLFHNVREAIVAEREAERRRKTPPKVSSKPGRSAPSDRQDDIVSSSDESPEREGRPRNGEHDSVDRQRRALLTMFRVETSRGNHILLRDAAYDDIENSARHLLARGKSAFRDGRFMLFILSAMSPTDGVVGAQFSNADMESFYTRAEGVADALALTAGTMTNV